MTERIIKEKNVLFTMVPILLKSIKNKQFYERGEFIIIITKCYCYPRALDAMGKKRLSPSVMAGCLGEEAALERRGV